MATRDKFPHLEGFSWWHTTPFKSSWWHHSTLRILEYLFFYKHFFFRSAQDISSSCWLMDEKTVLFSPLQPLYIGLFVHLIWHIFSSQHLITRSSDLRQKKTNFLRQKKTIFRGTCVGFLSLSTSILSPLTLVDQALCLTVWPSSGRLFWKTPLTKLWAQSPRFWASSRRFGPRSVDLCWPQVNSAAVDRISETSNSLKYRLREACQRWHMAAFGWFSAHILGSC